MKYLILGTIIGSLTLAVSSHYIECKEYVVIFAFLTGVGIATMGLSYWVER